MVRVTTPVHTFTLPFDTSLCDAIEVVYKQFYKKLVKRYENGKLPDGMELNGKDIVITLSQEETGRFSKGTAKIKIRVLTKSGRVLPSDEMEIDIEDTFSEDILK